MKIEYDGEVLKFDQESIELQQAMVIQLHTGMSISEWEDSLDVSEEKPPGPEWLKSVQCLYWAVLAQNGETVPIADANPKVGKFLKAYAAASAAETPAEPPEEPDPTQGSKSPLPSSEPASQKAPDPQEVLSPSTG